MSRRLVHAIAPPTGSPRGEVFGIVGPNGAGKTTVLECMSGLRRPDAGPVRVLGLDPQADRYAVRERIGVQLQAAALPDALRVGEPVTLFAAFYPRTGDPMEALRRVGLEERRAARVAALSGGQCQRLFIALALVHEPEVVLLDELTTRLDPQARRDAWALVREIRERGATVILTTHFMEEAERLCDRVAIIDRGRVVALDSVGRLIASLGEERRVVFTYEDAIDGTSLRGLPGVVRVERPTLEDVFLARTGGAPSVGDAPAT